MTEDEWIAEWDVNYGRDAEQATEEDEDEEPDVDAPPPPPPRVEPELDDVALSIADLWRTLSASNGVVPLVWPDSKGHGKHAEHFDRVRRVPNMEAITELVTSVVPIERRIYVIECLVTMLRTETAEAAR